MTQAPGFDAMIWTQQIVAGVKLRHFVARVGAVEVGTVTFDAGNGLWAWASPLADDAWGFAPTQAGARQAFTLWLLGWLDNFRPLIEQSRAAPP